MDSAQIEKWAAECIAEDWSDHIPGYYRDMELTRFAELVAAHERERLERQINEYRDWIGLRAKAELIAAIRNNAGRGE